MRLASAAAGVSSATATTAASTEIRDGDIASGTTGELTGESMTTTRLGAGTYRIEVHNWASPPGNQVALRTTFYNSLGQPGS